MVLAIGLRLPTLLSHNLAKAAAKFSTNLAVDSIQRGVSQMFTKLLEQMTDRNLAAAFILFRRMIPFLGLSNRRLHRRL